MRSKPLVANLALAVASAFAFLVVWWAGELAVRALDPRYLDRFGLDDIGYLHVYSESYGWVPRRSFRLKLGDGPVTTINAAGYRGPAYPLARTPGKKRVLMLGDSLAFGYGVGDEETSSRFLERQVPGLEVVNLAVQGYGTDQALLRFEAEGLAYRPDAAILNFCIANDFRDNGAQRSIYDGAYPKPYFSLEQGELVLHREHLQLSPLERLALFLHQRSVLYLELGRLLSKSRSSEAEAAAKEEHPPARELTIALLQRFARVAREHHVRLIIAIYPNYREFLAPSRRPGRILTAPGLESALVVDLRPRLEVRGIDRNTFPEYSLDSNFHANARGQRIVAEVLAELLRQADVLASGEGAQGP